MLRAWHQFLVDSDADIITGCVRAPRADCRARPRASSFSVVILVTRAHSSQTGSLAFWGSQAPALASAARLLLSYNIVNFDLPYLLNRAAKLQIKSFPFFGRIKGMPTRMKDKLFQSKQARAERGADVADVRTRSSRF
eukprot:4781049-Pleurochrysis_carterae.AAC.2